MKFCLFLQQEIEAALEKVCSFLPSTIRSEVCYYLIVKFLIPSLPPSLHFPSLFPLYSILLPCTFNFVSFLSISVSQFRLNCTVINCDMYYEKEDDLILLQHCTFMH